MFLNMRYIIDLYDIEIKEYKRNILNSRCGDMMNNIITYDDYYNIYNKRYFEMLNLYNNMVVYYNNFKNL